MSKDPAAIFAGFINKHPAEILDMMSSNVEALTGQTVEIDDFAPDSDDMAQKFGGKKIYVFPISDHASNPLPGLLALDFTGAVHSGAAFSLMGPGQIKEVLQSKEVPEILHDSIGEVANILIGAALDFVRERVDGSPEFRRGDTFELVRCGPWPDLLNRVADNVTWRTVGGRLLIEGEEKGAILFASGEPMLEQPAAAPEGETADGAKAAASSEPQGAEPDSPDAGEGAADDAAAAQAEPTPGGPAGSLSGLRVDLACHPADTGGMTLREQLTTLGASVGQAGERPGAADAVIVISRSPRDLQARVASLGGPEVRPGCIIACSDRPTQELVLAARTSRVSGFLVLPTSADRLYELLSKVTPAPASV